MVLPWAVLNLDPDLFHIQCELLEGRWSEVDLSLASSLHVGHGFFQREKHSGTHALRGCGPANQTEGGIMMRLLGAS